MALAVVVLVAVAGLVLATFFAASFVVPVVVAAPLGGADARESGAPTGLRQSP